MSDQSRYVNTYIDVAVGTAHEYLNAILQLKAENKLSNEIIQEKDGLITNLQNELEQERARNRLEHEAVDKANEQVKTWESEVNLLKGKASNFDALVNQFNELKRDFIAKDAEFNDTKQKLEEAELKINQLQNPVSKDQKSQIVNAKTTINKVTTPKKVVVSKVEQETDDF